MESNTLKRLLAAGVLAGVLGFGGVQIASAQTDPTPSTTTPAPSSDSTTPPDSSTAPAPGTHDPANCPNMGTGSGSGSTGTAFHGRHGGPAPASSTTNL
jgi:hypothetical protein